MAMAHFSNPHYTYQQTSFLPSLTVLIKTKVVTVLLVDCLSPEHKGKTWCQLTMGAGKQETKYSHCTEVRQLEILSPEQAVPLFGDQLLEVSHSCFPSVSPTLTARKQIANGLWRNLQLELQLSPQTAFASFVLCCGRSMSTGSGWPALEKEAALGSWRWSTGPPGLPLSRPRQTWSSGASTGTATDASWWWVNGRGLPHAAAAPPFPLCWVLWCFHEKGSHGKVTEWLNEGSWKKRGQDSAERRWVRNAIEKHYA